MTDMIEKQVKTALPIYIGAIVFVVCAFIAPIYSIFGIIISLVIALVAYFVADKILPQKTILVEAPKIVYATGEADLDQTLAKAAKDLEDLKRLNARIPEADLSAYISRMEKAGKAILEFVAKEPAKAKKIRRFVTYYLPTSIKLLTTYADLAASGASGENAQSLMREIKTNAKIVAGAFETQLDALFADKVLDVSSDITVLDSMLRGDGLSNSDLINKKT